MDNRLLIAKALSISYVSNTIDELGTDDVKDVVHKALGNITITQNIMGNNTERDLLNGMSSLIKSVLSPESHNPYSIEKILSEARIICRSDLEYVDILSINLGNDDDKASKKKKRMLQDIRSLKIAYKEDEIASLLGNASRDMNLNRNKITNTKEFVAELVSSLEEHALGDSKEDPSLVNTVIISSDPNEDDGSLLDMATSLKETEEGGKLWRLGWTGVNEMFQGGFRAGDFVGISALQHKYKTGFTLSILKHLVTLNKPECFMRDPDKKPLVIRFAFEDKPENDTRYLFQNAYYNARGSMPDISKYSSERISDIVSKTMRVNGWNVSLERRIPDDFTYMDMVSTIMKYETEGYEIHAVLFDQLPMISTVGCDRSGPMGTDIRSLFRKTTGFLSARDILTITPIQLGPDAKALLGSVPDYDFLNTIKGRGMFSGSKQLDQDLIISMYIHIVTHEDRSYLHVLQDKHRLPGIVPEYKKSLFLPFPEDGPIPDDINGDPIHLRHLPRSGFNSGL